jgi:hypothetical protein
VRILQRGQKAAVREAHMREAAQSRTRETEPRGQDWRAGEGGGVGCEGASLGGGWLGRLIRPLDLSHEPHQSR